MTKKAIVSLHKTIKFRWIPIYEGDMNHRSCALCGELGCDYCPVAKKYGGCCDDKEFGFRDWLNIPWGKHRPESLKVLQNLIRLLPAKERTATEKKYLAIKGDK